METVFKPFLKRKKEKKRKRRRKERSPIFCIFRFSSCLKE